MEVIVVGGGGGEEGVGDVRCSRLLQLVCLIQMNGLKV